MALFVDIEKRLGNFQLQVKFETQDQVLALLGASGCGKSMTLKCIAGIETPDRGKILLDGKVLFDSEKKINLTPQKRNVGYLFQQYALFPNMTVWQNIACGVRDKKRVKDVLPQIIVDMHLEGLEDKKPHQLSGGQQQRVALARILVNEPKVLLLDEPFSALDSHLRWELERQLMATLRKFSGAVLFVSHDRDEVYRIADHVAVYDQGKIDRMGDKWDVFQNPVTCSAARLTGCKNIAAAEFVENTVTVPEWGLSLLTEDVVPGAKFLGVRARKLRAAERPGPNVYPFTIVEEIQGAFSDILMIQLEAGKEPLRWEMTKEARQVLSAGPQLVYFPDDAVLTLTE